MKRWEYVLTFIPVVGLALVGLATEGTDGWIILGLALILGELKIHSVEWRRAEEQGRVEVHIEKPNNDAVQ